MNARSLRALPVIGLALLAACKSDAGVTPMPGIDAGQSLKLVGAQDVQLPGGASGADYVAVLVNTSVSAGASETFSLKGTGLGTAVGSVSPVGGATLDRLSSGGPLGNPVTLDRRFEARLRGRERSELTPRFAGARAWRRSRTDSRSSAGGTGSFDPSRRSAVLTSAVKVGDTVTVNVNGNDACTNPIYHKARVAALGTHAVVLADTANPAGGFTDADYQRYATRFDTLVYPIDVGAFGEPTDIDANGHVALIFTSEVNRLTPVGADSYVGGFTFSRDLFPVVASARAQACPASNEGEYFYLLTPDPLGTINGHKRSAGFVDSNTTAVIAHEFQHLINASRRLYLSDAASFEDTWLDEGLAHIAEELLFYHEAGVGPRSDLGTAAIRATQKRVSAFNLDMLGNSGRYRSFLEATTTSSPYADNDDLSTRGGAWSLLRYLADRRGSSDGDTWHQLVNSEATGIANVSLVFGADFAGMVRDWSVSNAVDDVSVTSAELQQPSWNWHSIYATLYNDYPLIVEPMVNGTPYSGSVVAGGSAYYKLSVPANGSATLTLGGQSAASGSHMQLVVVRTK